MTLKKASEQFDILLVVSVVLLGIISVFTVSSFFSGGAGFIDRQVVWLVIGFVIFMILSRFDLDILRQSNVIMALYVLNLALLLALFILGNTVKGATSWFSLGGLSFQPVDTMKVILVLVLAKYLSRRHVELASFKHILITGIYFFIPFLLVFLQPDFGSAIVLFCIWFGMMLFAGLSRKHLLVLFGVGVVAFGILWGFIFEDYQKDRILTFIHPVEDIQGAGYNAYQSTIAVGSGQLFGKGIGYGTQSRLNFLPESETDFVFAAFAEEWGFVGVIILFLLFGTLIYRIIISSQFARSNFEAFFIIGAAIYFMSHIIINIGMNIGLLPVTGITLPFLSYGGSHLLAEFIALGIMASMLRTKRIAHRDNDAFYELT